MKNKPNVLLIGPVPAPHGGVSVHIRRLSNLLSKWFLVDFIDESHIKKDNIYNIRTFNIIGYLIRMRRADIIFIHSGKTSLRFFHIFFAKALFKKVIITIHSYPTEKPNIFKFLDELVLNLADRIVMVNSIFSERLKIRTVTLMKNAFIPPNEENEKPLSNELLIFLDLNKKRGKKIIIANAWRLEKYKNEDLYGLDLCIEATKILTTNGINICFIFIVSSKESDGLYTYYKTLIKEYGLEDNFILLNEELSFVNLIKRSDIVVRPTNTDGDALTVRETLFLNKPIIASDVIIRPQGTILFKNRDTADLANKIEGTIRDYEDLISNNYPSENYEGFYANLIIDTLSNQ